MEELGFIVGLVVDLPVFSLLMLLMTKRRKQTGNCQSCARFQFVMTGIFFKRLLWAAATNLFAAWIIIDANLWHEFDKIQQNITNIKYDFIIGEFSEKKIEEFQEMYFKTFPGT